MKNIFLNLRNVLLVLLWKKAKNENLLLTDLNRWMKICDLNGSQKQAFLTLMSTSTPFRSVFYYRIKTGFITKLLFPGAKSLHINTKQIGGGLYVKHGFSTKIYANKIGDNFTIYHNTTIGSHNFNEPIIGNNVTIHTGAVVYGDIIIGNNVRIGPNAVVPKSVVSNSVVVSPLASYLIFDGTVDKRPL